MSLNWKVVVDKIGNGHQRFRCSKLRSISLMGRTQEMSPRVSGSGKETVFVVHGNVSSSRVAWTVCSEGN